MAYARMKVFLARQRKKLPFTALLTASPPGGIGALRALYESKIAVPGECSVACFGYEPEGPLYTPSLTNVGTTFEMWSESLVGLLKKCFSRQTRNLEYYPVPSQLFPLESTGKCPKQSGRLLKN